MTVADLIAKLHDFPVEMLVLVGGFDEWGFEPVDSFEIIEVAPVEQRSHGPSYTLTEDIKRREIGPAFHRIKTTGPAITALHLGR